MKKRGVSGLFNSRDGNVNIILFFFNVISNKNIFSSFFHLKERKGLKGMNCFYPAIVRGGRTLVPK